METLFVIKITVLKITTPKSTTPGFTSQHQLQVTPTSGEYKKLKHLDLKHHDSCIARK